MRNLVIGFLFVMILIEGSFIIHLYKKPQIIIKAVYENDVMDLPTVPKETIRGLN